MPKTLTYHGENDQSFIEGDTTLNSYSYCISSKEAISLLDYYIKEIQWAEKEILKLYDEGNGRFIHSIGQEWIDLLFQVKSYSKTLLNSNSHTLDSECEERLRCLYATSQRMEQLIKRFLNSL